MSVSLEAVPTGIWKYWRLWKNLEYPELIKFCSSSKEYAPVLDDRQTWNYLLKRDFCDIVQAPNDDIDPRAQYELIYWLGLFPSEKTLSFEAREGNDEFILNTLRELAKQEPQEPIECIVTSEGKMVARITGNHIYEIIIKVLFNLEVPKVQATQEFELTLTVFLFLMFGVRVFKKELTSFADIINEYKKRWFNEETTDTWHIERIDTLPVY